MSVRYWLIYFGDQDVKPEVFTNEAMAKERFLSLLPNWNCHLFMECVPNPANAKSGAEPGAPEAKE